MAVSRDGTKYEQCDLSVTVLFWMTARFQLWADELLTSLPVAQALIALGVK